DKVFNRVITVKKIGSNSTIVWNPNKDLAEMRAEQYKNFVCVEPANQGENFVKLKAKQKHKITMIIEVK
ncbi:MAG: D-hexose-6-phosphate mutarotase, partial [Alphaproteobacteria bacterium]|nr:D-hexose-6-phosphate mutarotase [Alphaproteobacteria bacterium]